MEQLQVAQDKLPEDFKKRWVELLRSGKYKQGKYNLKKYDSEEGDTYCCMGIACIAVGIEIRNDNSCHPFTSYEGYYNLIPEVLRDSRAKQELLSSMNDSEDMSFSEIADYIEQNL